MLFRSDQESELQRQGGNLPQTPETPEKVFYDLLKSTTKHVMQESELQRPGGGGPLVQANETLINAVKALRQVIDLGNMGNRETGEIELANWRIFSQGTIRKLLKKLETRQFMKQEHVEEVTKLRVGKEFDFSKWFPGFPIGDGELPPRPESDDRKNWLNNIWEDSGTRGIVRIDSLEDLFKVYLVICGFRMRDVYTHTHISLLITYILQSNLPLT